MIDEKKYEGHDLAKGRVGSDYNIYDRKGNIIFDADDVGSNMATLNLLADAPLLLAEVKRLREELAEVEYRLEMAEDVLGRSDWNTIYREIIDEVIE
tara:strand:+ start:149 stop:439 length:291 start_codon:yes stop_codon:yes gene_type:complete